MSFYMYKFLIEVTFDHWVDLIEEELGLIYIFQSQLLVFKDSVHHTKVAFDFGNH